MLSDAALDSYVAGVKFYFSMPGMRAAWRASEGQFGSAFRAFGNALLIQTPLGNVDAYSRWRKLLESESRTVKPKIESPTMIRDKRTFIIVSAVGLAGGVLLLFLHVAYPPTHPVYPRWLSIAIDGLLIGGFAYNIILRLRGPIQPARWARNLPDRQLWILRGITFPIILAIALIPIVLIRVHLPKWVWEDIAMAPLIVIAIFLGAIIALNYRNRVT